MPETITLKEINSYSITVIDGGSLVYRVRWLKGATFSEVAKAYIQYVKSNYTAPIVIFDGYGLATTKDHEHNRRNLVPRSSFIRIESDNAILQYPLASTTI